MKQAFWSQPFQLLQLFQCLQKGPNSAPVVGAFFACLHMLWSNHSEIEWYTLVALVQGSERTLRRVRRRALCFTFPPGRPQVAQRKNHTWWSRKNPSTSLVVYWQVANRHGRIGSGNEVYLPGKRRINVIGIKLLTGTPSP